MQSMNVSASEVSPEKPRHVRSWAVLVIFLVLIVLYSVGETTPTPTKSEPSIDGGNSQSVLSTNAPTVSEPSSGDSQSVISRLKAYKNAEILTFGDSLTFGFLSRYDFQKRYPYATQLSSLLDENVKHFNVTDSGVPGERSVSMLTRLPQLLSQHTNARLVCILAGTNDLLTRRSEETAQNIISLHESAHAAFQRNVDADGTSPGGYTVMLTIPQVLSWSYKNNEPDAEAKRLEINSALREYARLCSDRVILVDLESQWDQAIESNRKRFWLSDLIHFTVEGYSDMARLVYEALQAPLPTEGQVTCPMKSGSGTEKKRKDS